MEQAHPAQLTSARRPGEAIARIALNWVVIFAALLAVARWPSVPMFIAVFVLVSIQQHALGMWMHESAHWLLAPRKKINDLIANFFLAGPLYVPLNAYRGRHFTHHGYLGTEQDTKRVIFTRVEGWKILRFLVWNCFGLQLFTIAWAYVRNPAPSSVGNYRFTVPDIAWLIVMQAALFLIIASFAPWHYYIWFWLLPWITLNRFIAGVRSVIEHQPLPGEQHPFTRTFRTTLADRLVFCRAGFDWHWTHHQYPNIPWFNLGRVDIATAQPVEKRGTYFGTLWRIIRQPRTEVAP